MTAKGNWQINAGGTGKPSLEWLVRVTPHNTQAARALGRRVGSDLENGSSVNADDGDTLAAMLYAVATGRNVAPAILTAFAEGMESPA